MCPTVTPAEFAELLKREILRAISKFTRSFDGEMNLNVYKDENQYGFRFEFEHL
jgi:septum formation topological specificity factor MinE